MTRKTTAQRRKNDVDRGKSRPRSQGRRVRGDAPRIEERALKIQTFTAFDLQRMEFPPVRYAVEGFIAEGLTLFGGKPKIGKSWMAVDFAMAVARGGLALGSIPTNRGVVLYAALEDNQRRLQRRMRKLYGDDKNWPKGFHLTTEICRLDKGGLEDLEQWIEAHDPVLIILDTLAHVKPVSRRESGGYESDYEALAPLQRLAGEQRICIIVIHHLRKMMGDDPLDMISGTTGLTGAVDNILVLNRNSGGTTLYGRGREIEEMEMAVEMKGGAWKLLGTASEVRRSEERQAILDLLENRDKALGPKEIADSLQRPVNNVKQLLFHMAKAGELSRTGRGRYQLPA